MKTRRNPFAKVEINGPISLSKKEHILAELRPLQHKTILMASQQIGMDPLTLIAYLGSLQRNGIIKEVRFI
ncbi:MAG: hypothetical protein QXR93_06795 [Archaeoglobaceae archaeon]